MRTLFRALFLSRISYSFLVLRSRPASLPLSFSPSLCVHLCPFFSFAPLGCNGPGLVFARPSTHSGNGLPSPSSLSSPVHHQCKSFLVVGALHCVQWLCEKSRGVMRMATAVHSQKTTSWGHELMEIPMQQQQQQHTKGPRNCNCSHRSKRMQLSFELDGHGWEEEVFAQCLLCMGM